MGIKHSEVDALVCPNFNLINGYKPKCCNM